MTCKSDGISIKSGFFSAGLMVEVVEDKNRQKAVMYEMHAGTQVMKELTAKGIKGHVEINKTVE